MPDTRRVVKLATLLSGKPLVGISINHEHMTPQQVQAAKADMHRKFHVPVEDPVFDGVVKLADAIEKLRDGEA
jgi:uncharacterized NAD-dependent epimerase/dehydratase family protein